MKYLATFFTHYDALQCFQMLKRLALEKGEVHDTSMRPVPRCLSSSCGTCVAFQSRVPPTAWAEDVPGIQGLYHADRGSYRLLFERE